MVVWQTPPSKSLLKPDEIHLWKISLNCFLSTGDFDYAFLSRDEMERAQRFHSKEDMHRYMVARCILRIILGSYLDTNPKQVLFRYNPSGKPFVSSASDLEFNISHSHDLLLIALRRQAVVGVDTEIVRPLEEIDRLAASILSQSEQHWLNNAPTETRVRLFYRFWVRREAYTKAVGQGFTMPSAEIAKASSISTYLLEDETKFSIKPQGKNKWMCLEFEPEPNYLAALVTPETEILVRCFFFPCDENRHILTSQLPVYPVSRA